MGNLIENLGGYEEAKKQGEEWGFDDTLNRALLEYRRQHNIFEVGEKVVLNTGSRIYKIDHIYKKAVWLDSGKDQLDVVNIDDIIRHATDVEIEAGCRLE